MKDQMLQDKYNEICEAHVELPNVIAQKDERILELEGALKFWQRKLDNLEDKLRRNDINWLDLK